MSTKNPQLGTLALQAPSSKPQVVRVTPATCHDLSLFKDILKEYRRLDDTIVMRLNRANALVRDQERVRQGGQENVQNQACIAVWRELLQNWKRRTQLVEYCSSVVDQSLEEKRNALEGQASDPRAQRKTQAAIFSGEVERNQVRNELVVESIVRKRTADAFHARCQYFVPPPLDEETKVWEEAVHR